MMNDFDAVMEFNDKGVTLWSCAYPDAFARGETLAEAQRKLPAACRRYRLWARPSQETASLGHEEARCVKKLKVDVAVEEGFTVALLPEERLPMDMTRYTALKTLCLSSARDWETLYASIPQKDRALLKSRRTLYGKVPVTAKEMLAHVEAGQREWAALFGIDLGESRGLLTDRKRLFAGLEAQPAYLSDRIITAPNGELWTLKKLLRRLLWHDAIHGRALYRKAITFWQKERIKNPFGFTK
jgi:hypothetical protein